MKDEGKKRPAHPDIHAADENYAPHPSSLIPHPSGQAPTPQPSRRIEVVAAILINESGQFLLAQRPVGKAYAGYWEFPGGKVERGETAHEALGRELHEELGIRVVTAYPWLTRDHDYAHAAVRLHFYRVLKWAGELQGREQQDFAWQTSGDINVAPLLPANGPILRALELPSIYGISCAGEFGRTIFMQKLERALRGGLRLIQVREKQLNADDLRTFADEVITVSRRYGARVVLNGPTGIAGQVHADGLHLTSRQLMSAARRPACSWCGASCHNVEELERARELGLDFVVLGPVNMTPSHPNAVPLGWPRFSQLIRDYPLPVYALGGMRAADLTQAWKAGAHGIAMMRAAWKETAIDPDRAYR